jgi:hypothetical protein
VGQFDCGSRTGLENGRLAAHIQGMAAGFKVTITHPSIPPQIWYAAIPDADDAAVAVSDCAQSTADESMQFDELTAEQVKNLGLSRGEVRRG